jgi:hypothetical protein
MAVRAADFFLGAHIPRFKNLQYHCIKFAVAGRYSTVNCVIRVMF